MAAVDRRMGSSPCSQPGIDFTSVSAASARRSAICATPADTCPAAATFSGACPAASACLRGSATISALSSSPQCIPSSIGSPRSAASLTLLGEVRATITSGQASSGAVQDLVRPRHDRDLPKAESFPRAGHAGLAQPAQEQVERLREALLVRLEARAEHLEVHPGPAAPHAEREPPAGGEVQQCRLFAAPAGCAVGSTDTAVPTLIRCVRPSNNAAGVTADGHTPYGTK
ncbi:hypothetical protein SFIMM107S_05144 [Streptomyces griseus]